MKVEPPPMAKVMAKTVDMRIRVSFQYLMKAIMKAAMKVAIAVSVSPVFSEMPSWMRFVSAVILVVISPAPNKSKKAIFCRSIAAR